MLIEDQRHDDKDDYDRAIADFSEAIVWTRKNPDVFNYRGMTWRSKADYDRAIADLTRRSSQSKFDAFSNRGSVNFLKKTSNVPADYTWSAVSDPMDPDSRIELGS